MEDSTQGPDLKKLYVKVDGINFYLVPISVLKISSKISRIATNEFSEKRIVAAKIADISGSPALWTDDDITPRIQNQFPINPE